MNNIEKLLRKKILQLSSLSMDSAHDIFHVERVVNIAKKLAATEGGKLEVIIPAAWLHDFVNIPKNDPQKSKSSYLSSDLALRFLSEIRYPSEYHDEIAHAIEAHSFSAGVECRTIEAKIVQDADRLDSIGAIGIARCFFTAGLLNTSLYQPIDPFCKNRIPNDKKSAVDHFYSKLLHISQRLNTQSARKEGEKRTLVIQHFLENLDSEISGSILEDAKFICPL